MTDCDCDDCLDLDAIEDLLFEPDVLTITPNPIYL